MKYKKLFAMSLVTIQALSMGHQVFAAEYEGPAKATTGADVEILPYEGGGNVPDPENPDEPLHPELPVNPNPGELKINYVSTFDFGRHMNVSSELVVNALLDELNLDAGPETHRVPFVATEDRRGTNRQGWELRVSQPTPFEDSEGNELSGATIKLSGLRYVDTNNAPVVTGGDIVLDSEEKVLATANEIQGAGAWSLALGSPTTEGTTDGVTLNIPQNTIKNNVSYGTQIVWELIADPSVGLN
ncbi:cell surface protein [Enterococcus casseliflavus]|nr:cell surface protein [Enterococcus casseliflavus]